MPIQVNDLSQSFGSPPQKVLHELNFEIADGEFVALTGRSGSGKSTLLYVLSTLDRPTSGSVLIDGEDVNQMSVQQQHQFRNEKLGFVFQFHYLLPELTAIQNILLPAFKTKREAEFRERAGSLMKEFGLAGKEDRLPSQLSGGEQQRIAIARALILNPKYIFADEPTGNLDTQNGEIILGFLEKLNQKEGTTIIMVTHDPGFAARAKRQIHLVDGSDESLANFSLLEVTVDGTVRWTEWNFPLHHRFP